MPNHSYCGPAGPLFPTGNVTALMDSDCFITGFFMYLPFALALLVLLWEGIRAFVQWQRPAQYGTIQGDAVPLDNEDPQDVRTDPTAPFAVEAALQLRWIGAFFVIGCGALEIAELITTEHFEWYQLVSPMVRALGVVLCLMLYALAGDYQPRLRLVAVTALVWGLCAAAGGLRIRYLVIEHRSHAPRLHYVTACAYSALTGCVALFDTYILMSFWCCARDYQPLATEDLDADGLPAPAPSPVVATCLSDPELYYVHDKVNFLSRISYQWISGLLREAYRQPLQMPRLGKLPLRDSAAYNFANVYRRFKEQPALRQGTAERANLQRPIWRQFALPMFIAWICKQTADLLGFIGPVALKGIIQFITKKQDKSYHPATEAELDDVLTDGWVLAAILFLSPLLQSTLLQTYYFLTIRTSINVQSALMSMIYHKALTLNMETLPADITIGSIVSYMSADVTTIGFFFQFAHYCFTVPVQLFITLYLLYWNIGWAGPASLLVVIVLLPLQFWLGHVTAAFQKKVMAENDGRLKLLNELIQGIKVIKFYAWESIFTDRITAKRGMQLHFLLLRKLCGAGTICLALSTPALITCTGFAFFSLWSSTPLTAGVAFSALSLFNILLLPMFTLPTTINAWINAVVSSNRILKFLLMPTMDRSFLHHDYDAATKVAVDIDGTFQWETGAPSDAPSDAAAPPPPEASSSADTDPAAPSVPRVERFEFKAQIQRGSLTMVVGAVGTGKSTLIKAMLGDVPCRRGAVRLHGRVAYVPQAATIFNATVRSNILFGLDHDPQRYGTVLAASGLEQDLAILPERDLTEIGEKGINLSGGQKQRVSIARALYAWADVVVFDDPLSALDAHVGEHVFNEAVLRLLVGQGRTVIMCTHQWQYLKHAHHILLVKGNAIQAQGTMDELTAAGYDLMVETYVPEKGADDADDGDDDVDDEAVGRCETSSLGSREPSGLELSQSLDTSPKHSGSLARTGSSMRRRRTKSKGADKEAEANKGKLIEAEEREIGAVSWSVYMTYFKAAGAVWTVLLLAWQVTARFCNVGSGVFLSHWSTAGGAHSVGWYLGVFTAITLAGTLVAGLANVCQAVAAVGASTKLHRDMLSCISRCPMAFFDVTPMGRIINRFSNDIQNVDMLLPDSLNQVVGISFSLVASLITIIGINPILAVLLVPVAALYYFIQSFFRHTSRELQRLNNISKSPIFAHLSETLGGVATIRAYGATQRFSQQNMEYVDRNVTAFLTLTSANRWLGLRLDSLGALIVSSTAFACIAKSDLSPGLAGLSLSYALQFVQYVSFTIRAIADAEMQMNSVERMSHYTNLEAEMPNFQDEPHPDQNVPSNWPQNGTITIRNLICTYRLGLPHVLKSVSLKIKGGERVGICGRTGSGKTTLLLALFRMLRTEGGSVIIDDQDISRLPLTFLRGRMAVIPQDPVLFAGTVRYNLDPAGRQPDEKLWEALRVAQLGDVVKCLDDEVLENGENFSMGQRQLFCLARAFLKQSRILCLDEATASVDQDTDKVIQGLIRTVFVGCTIVTIAHRISTIMDYDKVLVLAEGRVVEYDSPATLLQSESVFKSLVDASKKHEE